MLIEGTECINSTVKLAGAAIFVWNGYYSKKTLKIRSSCLKRNKAGKSGGAIFLSKSQLTIKIQPLDVILLQVQ